MANNAVLNLTLAVDLPPATVAHRLNTQATTAETRWKALKKIINGATARGYKGTLLIHDSTTGSTDNVADNAAVTVTITDASLVGDTDTLTIGDVTITWKTSGASGENEINIGGSDTLSGDALVAGINGHSKLEGIFFASNASGVVTITYYGDPRVGDLIGISEAGSGQVIGGSATDFSLDTTEAVELAQPITFANGLP